MSRLPGGAMLGWALVAQFLVSAASAADKPNIVVILADDLGYGDLGCYNAQSKIPTPNLDRLAAQGIRLTDAHSPSAVCSPTRYGLLTGRYAWRTRLKSGVLGPWDRPLIEPGQLTLPALLKGQGYATACIGKWHLGWSWPTKDGQPARSGPDRLSNVDFTKPIPDGPTTRGFDSYFGVDLPNYPPYCFIENDRTAGVPSRPSTEVFNRPGPMLPGWDWVDIMPELTRRAEAYIDEAARTRRGAPFFLYLPLSAPHYPVVPSPEFRGKSGAGDFGDFVVQVDATVGRVMQALERTGLAENTLLVFTSDNGPEITGEVKVGVYDRLRRYGHASMGQLRGAKRDAWEGGHRVPFLARWPGHVPAGARSDELVCLTDMMATIAAVLEVPLPEGAAEDSRNVLPALLGGKAPSAPVVLHGAGGKFVIREGPWVLIDAPTGQENGPARGEPAWFKEERGYRPHSSPGELYDLGKDFAQRDNLFDAQPATAARLKALLDQIRQEKHRESLGLPGRRTQLD